MRIHGFDWDDWNLGHIDRHQVTPQEVEEACYNQPISKKTRNGLFLIYGQTDSGRYLLSVIRLNTNGVAYTITARPMIDKEKRFYNKG